MKKCPYCGFNNPDSALVCLNCGRSLAGVKEDDFVISPDEDTSYILGKREELIKISKRSKLPFFVDFFMLLLIWLFVFGILLFLSFTTLLAMVIAGVFTTLFFLFVEFVLLFSGEGTFGEILVKKEVGDRKKIILFLMLTGFIPLFVAAVILFLK